MRQSANIDPGLKAWIDHVFVPALVRQHLEASREGSDNNGGRFPLPDSGTSNEEPVQ
jgi:hypothetical protein